jgi:hypothetical protein
VQHYRVLADNVAFADRWFLDEPLSAEGRHIDARLFTYGEKYVGPSPVAVPVRYWGRPVSVHLAAFDMPVVTRQVAQIIQGIAPQAVERFSVLVANDIAGYEILNVLTLVDCLDQQRSIIQRWTEADKRPDKTGKPEMVMNLQIDPARAAGHHIFRIRDWDVALIVSDTVKGAIEGIVDLGIVFQAVV